jgi:hypothetical protein
MVGLDPGDLGALCGPGRSETVRVRMVRPCDLRAARVEGRGGLLLTSKQQDRSLIPGHVACRCSFVRLPAEVTSSIVLLAAVDRCGSPGQRVCRLRSFGKPALEILVYAESRSSFAIVVGQGFLGVCLSPIFPIGSRYPVWGIDLPFGVYGDGASRDACALFKIWAWLV